MCFFVMENRTGSEAKSITGLTKNSKDSSPNVGSCSRFEFKKFGVHSLPFCISRAKDFSVVEDLVLKTLKIKNIG